MAIISGKEVVKIYGTRNVDASDYQVMAGCVAGAYVPPPPGCVGPKHGQFTLHGQPVDVLPDGHVLLYSRARHYDVKHGRWLQRDPMGYVDGGNLYEGYSSNTVARVDPMGTDDIIEHEDGSLEYRSIGWTQGWTWVFAKREGPETSGFVLIDHPDWPVAFRMKKKMAKTAFDTPFYEDDFKNHWDFLAALTLAVLQKDTSEFGYMYIKDKGPDSEGWMMAEQFLQTNDTVVGQERAERLLPSLRAAYGKKAQTAKKLVAAAHQAVTGALAAPAGMPGMVVDATGTAIDTATGRMDPKTGAAIIAVTAAALVLDQRTGVVSTGADATEQSIAQEVKFYKSFGAMKRAVGSPGQGNVWHHIVEQRAVNIQQFGEEAIHNTTNVIAVPTRINQTVANYYSSVPQSGFTGGRTVRDWLAAQSWREQYDFGIDILNRATSGGRLP